jgi:hypothetical protein
MALIKRALLVLSDVLAVTTLVVPVRKNLNPGVDQLFFQAISPFTSALMFPPSTSQSNSPLTLGQVLFAFVQVPAAFPQQSSSQMTVAPDPVIEKMSSTHQKRPKTRKMRKKNKHRQSKRAVQNSDLSLIRNMNIKTNFRKTINFIKKATMCPRLMWVKLTFP